MGKKYVFPSEKNAHWYEMQRKFTNISFFQQHNENLREYYCGLNNPCTSGQTCYLSTPCPVHYSTGCTSMYLCHKS